MNSKGYTIVELLVVLIIISSLVIGFAICGFVLYKGTQVADSYIESVNKPDAQKMLDTD